MLALYCVLSKSIQVVTVKCPSCGDPADQIGSAGGHYCHSCGWGRVEYGPVPDDTPKRVNWAKVGLVWLGKSVWAVVQRTWRLIRPYSQ